MKTPAEPEQRPTWDAYHRKLWLGKTLAREFPRDAPDQIAVLNAFEANGWPSLLDVHDLIPPGVSGKAWVKYTVENLNRNIRGIRFHGNGPNQTIAWGAGRTTLSLSVPKCFRRRGTFWWDRRPAGLKTIRPAGRRPLDQGIPLPFSPHH